MQKIHSRYISPIPGAINFDPVKYVKETLSRVWTMHAKWTLIHLGGITDSCVALWSYFQYKVWSTFKLFEKWILIHFWFLMKCLKELLKAVDFKINFELDYFSNNNRTSTVIISLTNVWNELLNLDLIPKSLKVFPQCHQHKFKFL